MIKVEDIGWIMSFLL